MIISGQTSACGWLNTDKTKLIEKEGQESLGYQHIDLSEAWNIHEGSLKARKVRFSLQIFWEITVICHYLVILMISSRPRIYVSSPSFLGNTIFKGVSANFKVEPILKDESLKQRTSLLKSKPTSTEFKEIDCSRTNLIL